MQPKPLRLIQEREFRPMGALQWRQADLRIVAATHRDLKAEVAAGRFRQDLYFRLNVLTIRLPPLRDRKSDIPVLVEHFLEGGRAAGLAAFSPDTRTMAAFRAYDWPGNVRELKHCIDRMSAMYSDGALQTPDMRSALQDFLAARDLDRLADAVNSSPASDAQLPEEVIAPVSPVISLSQSKRLAIEKALAATHGKRGKAARLLGIGRTTLYRKMKQYGIE